MLFIIVLGNSNKKVMNNRVDAAIHCFNTYKSKIQCFYVAEYGNTNNQYIIVSGGGKGGSKIETNNINETNNRFDNTTPNSEAKYMKNYAVSRGIDEKYIITENDSYNTEQNILNSKKLIEQWTDNNTVDVEIIICTSSFHIPRAKVIALNILGKYDLKYIHTNEIITPEQHMREMRLIYSYVLHTLKSI